MLYQYRDKFHLSYQELLDEPTDQFFTNLYIYAQIREKERIVNEHG